MKQLLFLFLFISATPMLNAQPWDSVTTKRDQIFTRTEIEPAFAGGEQAWTEFLSKNLTSKVGRKGPSGVYAVGVQFIVHTDGTLTDVKAVTNHGYGMEKEAERIIKNTPKWIPAKQNGQEVTCYHRQVIRFTIE